MSAFSPETDIYTGAKRTFISASDMAALGQKQTGPRHCSNLFDHVISCR